MKPEIKVKDCNDCPFVRGQNKRSCSIGYGPIPQPIEEKEGVLIMPEWCPLIGKTYSGQIEVFVTLDKSK